MGVEDGRNLRTAAVDFEVEGVLRRGFMRAQNGAIREYAHDVVAGQRALVHT